MNVVFCGTPAWAVPALDALHRSAHRVTGVVTLPDAPAGRSRHPAASCVKSVALAHGIGPILQPDSLKPAAAREAILALAPDVLAVVAYGRILPGRLLDGPRHGAVNLHFSLLPRHRGASPVQYTLLCGDAVAGVTTMRMERELDAGPVFLQREVAIDPRDTAQTLGARLAEVGASLLVTTLDGLERGTLTATEQDARLATWAPPLTRKAGALSWRETATQIARRVRAFQPWPGVTFQTTKGEVRILEADALSDPAPADAVPGFVWRRSGVAVDVVAGAGTVVRITRVQPASRQPMQAAAALAGRTFTLGERLQDGAA